MSTTAVILDLAVARRLRSRQVIDRLDYLRALRRLARTMSQIDIARSLGVTQPAISMSLKSAAKVPEVRDGFSGANPYEIAQRFAAGELDRSHLVDELGRWQHDGAGRTGTSDPVSEGPEGPRAGEGAEGDWDEEVRRALGNGLLDAEVYAAVQERAEALRATT